MDPWSLKAPFYKLTFGDLKGRMPFATPMQLYDAAEKLTNILNETFTEEARKLAFSYDRADVIQPHPQVSSNVLRLSNTGRGSEGQVIPGLMILEGEAAVDFYHALPHKTLAPLSNLPPWTHMVNAEGSWWLVQLG